MQKLAIWIGSSVLFIGGLVLLIPLCTLCGAISGWIVEWFFDAPLIVLSAMGVKGITMWQLGAFLGFITPFLRTKIQHTAS